MKKLLIVLSILFLSISKSAVAVPAMLAAECFPYKKLQDIIINDHKENIFAAGINHGDMLLKIYLNKITKHYTVTFLVAEQKSLECIIFTGTDFIYNKNKSVSHN